MTPSEKRNYYNERGRAFLREIEAKVIYGVVSESRQMKRKMVAVKRKKQEEDNQDDSVPDTAAKEFNGGHGLKTSLMAGLKKIL